MLKNILLLFLGTIIFNGCTRDDICASGTATTPLLIITFNDAANPSVRKGVSGLQAVLINGNASQTFLPNSNNDSIAIPLNTNAGVTRYFLNRDIGGPTENIDKITISYQTNAVYVNRACGYKTIYSGLNTTQEAVDGTNWILSRTINQTTVADDKQAHITILH